MFWLMNHTACILWIAANFEQTWTNVSTTDDFLICQSLLSNDQTPYQYMTESLSPKPMSASRVTLSQLMHPEHVNLLGNVHGGWIMKLVDEAAALACMRHAQKKVVT